ncbi:MAG: hypothetical protein ABI634_01280 [Acidobacteriota bacterium]
MTNTNYCEHARLLARTVKLKERTDALASTGTCDLTSFLRLRRDLAMHRLEFVLYRMMLLPAHTSDGPPAS